eukprot:1146042-Pelagomonas_calceolata.AAC.4
MSLRKNNFLGLCVEIAAGKQASTHTQASKGMRTRGSVRSQRKRRAVRRARKGMPALMRRAVRVRRGVAAVRRKAVRMRGAGVQK